MTHLNTIADVIVNTRDFCGNEREAAFEEMAELGIPREERKVLFIRAMATANGIWRKSQKAAGVNRRFWR